MRSLRRNLENFQSHLLEELQLHFSVIGITETKITNSNLPLDFDPSIPNYRFEYVPTPLSAGGVSMYIHNDFNYTVIERTCDEAFQGLWVEIQIAKKSTVICGVIYRQHNSPEKFLNYFEQTVEKLSATGRRIFIMTNANINLLSYEWCKYAQEFLHLLQSYSFIPTIDKPTRVLNKSATLIDNIFINNYDSKVYSGNIVSDISDHYTQFCVCNALGNKSKFMPPKVKLRDYSKFSESQFLNHLAQLNWESVEGDDINTSFSVFYNKLDRVVNKHAPLKSVSKRKAKQLSKPWISRGIKTSIRKKNELYYSGDMAKYRLYRNKIITLTRLSKKLYYHTFLKRI